jgi:hypothetical protein
MFLRYGTVFPFLIPPLQKSPPHGLSPLSFPAMMVPAEKLELDDLSSMLPSWWGFGST